MIEKVLSGFPRIPFELHSIYRSAPRSYRKHRGKRPAMSSRPANSRQYLFQRQNVVRRLRMFGQGPVNRRAVSVTQGESGSARGKALPKKLEQPELLFGGQLEEFSNVRVTHGA